MISGDQIGRDPGTTQGGHGVGHALANRVRQHREREERRAVGRVFLGARGPWLGGEVQREQQGEPERGRHVRARAVDAWEQPVDG